MISQFISQSISNHTKIFALLIDPDKHTQESLTKLSSLATKSGVDLILVINKTQNR